MMNTINKKLYALIGLSLVVSYVFTSYLSNNIFIANTPTVRPDLKSYLANSVRNAPVIAQIVNSGKSAAIAKQVKDVPLVPVTKGVYAKSAENITYTTIHQNELELIEYVFIVNGKQVKIRVPKGQRPPTQDLVEKLY